MALSRQSAAHLGYSRHDRAIPHERVKMYHYQTLRALGTKNAGRQVPSNSTNGLPTLPAKVSAHDQYSNACLCQALQQWV